MSIRSATTATTTNQETGGETKSPSTTELSINLIGEFSQENITWNKPTQEILKHLRNWACMMKSPQIRLNLQSPVLSWCLTKPNLLKQMQLSEEGTENGKRALIDHRDLSVEGNLVHPRPLNKREAHNWPQEVEEQMNHYSPGPPMKIHKCLSSHQAKSFCESWSKTILQTSKSLSTICSAQGSSQSSPTQSGSRKNCWFWWHLLQDPFHHLGKFSIRKIWWLWIQIQTCQTCKISMEPWRVARCIQCDPVHDAVHLPPLRRWAHSVSYSKVVWSGT